MEKATNLDQVESYRPQAAVIFETTLTLKEKEVTVKDGLRGKPCFATLIGRPLLLLLKALSVLAGGVIGVKQTVFNTQELELPRSLDVGF